MPAGNMDPSGKTAADITDKYLIFELQGEDYGVSIYKVKEIIGMMPITSVPRTRASTKGVINLRGKVIPVIDLKVKFNMPGGPYSDRTCIIVIELNSAADTGLTGIIVDGVSEVLGINKRNIDDPPSFGANMHTGDILGIAKTKNGIRILLDIDRVLHREEPARFEPAV